MVMLLVSTSDMTHAISDFFLVVVGGLDGEDDFAAAKQAVNIATAAMHLINLEKRPFIYVVPFYYIESDCTFFVYYRTGVAVCCKGMKEKVA